MKEQKHILDILIEKVDKKLGKDIKVYLAINDDKKEVLAIKTKDQERGLDLSQIVNSYGFYRIYQADSEKKAIELLANSLIKSISDMLNTASKEK
jgi:hypothetical protein